MTVATVIATSGCNYLNAWRCGNSGCCNAYGDGVVYDDGAVYGDGAIYGDGQYPVYAPGDGAIVGPEFIVPGETIAAPAGEPLPGPAQ